MALMIDDTEVSRRQHSAVQAIQRSFRDEHKGYDICEIHIVAPWRAGESAGVYCEAAFISTKGHRIGDISRNYSVGPRGGIRLA